MSIVPLNDSILFSFVNDQTRSNGHKMFRETTESGLILDSYDTAANSPQWGIVLEAGPDVDPSVKPGTHILIESLKWTEEHQLNKVSFWRTTEPFVMCIKE